MVPVKSIETCRHYKGPTAAHTNARTHRHLEIRWAFRDDGGGCSGCEPSLGASLDYLARVVVKLFVVPAPCIPRPRPCRTPSADYGMPVHGFTPHYIPQFNGVFACVNTLYVVPSPLYEKPTFHSRHPSVIVLVRGLRSCTDYGMRLREYIPH